MIPRSVSMEGRENEECPFEAYGDDPAGPCASLDDEYRAIIAG